MVMVRTLGKGQVVIPKAVRKMLQIIPGTLIWLRVDQGQIVLKPMPKDPVKALRGVLKKTGPSTADLLRWRKEERTREEREIS